MKVPTIQQIEKVAEMPVEEWAGYCGSICCDIIEAELVEGGEILSGFWLGPVNFDAEYVPLWLSEYFKGQKFPQHCWIRFGNNKILDATRWVFEGVKPYIYYGNNDYYQIT